jgi:predicted nucleic acid-binding protein
MLLVDTSILVDVLQDDPQWGEWSTTQLRAQAQIHELAINSVIYAEMSIYFRRAESLDQLVEAMHLRMEEIPKAALFLAGKAFVHYRKRGGTKTQVLPDFFIGAHATVQNMALLTRDASRFKTYFPTLQVISPQ